MLSPILWVKCSIFALLCFLFVRKNKVFGVTNLASCQTEQIKCIITVDWTNRFLWRASHVSNKINWSINVYFNMRGLTIFSDRLCSYVTRYRLCSYRIEAVSTEEAFNFFCTENTFSEENTWHNVVNSMLV